MSQTNPTSPVNAVTCWSGSGSGGKTTTAVNTAAAHGRHGHKTLVIDLDPQKASITGRVGYGSLMSSSEYNIAHVMFDLAEGEDKDLSDLVIPQSESGLDFDLIPAHEKLEDFGKLVSTHWQGSQLIVLRWWLKNSGLYDEYDTIFVDVHGTKGPLVKNAITATQNVIIPTLPNGKGENSAMSVKEYMAEIQTTFSKMEKSIDLNILAVVPNKSKSYGKNERTSETETLEFLRGEGFPVTPFRFFEYNIHNDAEKANGTIFEYAESPRSEKISDRHVQIFSKYDALSKIITTGSVDRVPTLVPFEDLDIIDHARVLDTSYGTEETEEVIA